MSQTDALHPDDVAVDRFASAMKAKLAKKRAEGYGGWDNPDECTIEHLSQLLISHVAKGDPVDIGNLAMMIHQRGGLVASAALVSTEPKFLDDKKRLDFLDGMNRVLNARYGTQYRWKLILNHNVNRLMLGYLEVDLNDGEANGLPSCRAAIDAEMRRIERSRPTAESDRS